MRVEEQSPEVLAVAVRAGCFPWACLGIFLACAAVAARQALAGPGSTHAERFQGALGGSAVGLLGFLFGHEEAQFRFDRRRGELAWRRRRSLWRSGGSLPLGAIQGVEVQVAMGSSHQAPKRRVVLQTSQGILPLEIAYRPGSAEECASVAEAIRTFLALAPAPGVDPLDDAVRALVAAGDVIGAVKRLRVERRLGLTEAKAEVERLRREGPPPGPR